MFRCPGSELRERDVCCPDIPFFYCRVPLLHFRAMSVPARPTANEIKHLMLDEDDFGHEMRVGAIFDSVNRENERNLGHSTRIETPEHGGTYIDSHTEKPR